MDPLGKRVTVREAYEYRENRDSAFLSTLLEPETALEKPDTTGQLNIFFGPNGGWSVVRQEQELHISQLLATNCH